MGTALFFRYILEHFPRFRDRVQCVIVEKYSVDGQGRLRRDASGDSRGDA